MSSGGMNAILMNMGDSGDADDGGREGETRYFNDVTQDEGTGGDTYTREQVMLSHHEAIPQSSSGISGQFVHHSGSLHHPSGYSSGVPGM